MLCQNAHFLKTSASVFKVPEPPKKAAPEVVPVPTPKKVEPPPAKGRIIYCLNFSWCLPSCIFSCEICILTKEHLQNICNMFNSVCVDLINVW